jgi:hypothetical protein
LLEAVFLQPLFLEPLSKLKQAYLCGFISGFSILFHWSSDLFCAGTRLFLFLWLCSSV